MRDITVDCVIYREGDDYVAQCLNVDIASDGPTEAEARANLTEALELLLSEPAAAALLTTVEGARLERVTVRST